MGTADPVGDVTLDIFNGVAQLAVPIADRDSLYQVALYAP
jgi:hypothetical protein